LLCGGVVAEGVTSAALCFATHVATGVNDPGYNQAHPQCKIWVQPVNELTI
jgi:hypothetical protein